MIYLDNENIIIPNLNGDQFINYTLVLKNNVTNETVILDASNLSDNELYYSFNLDVSSLSPNEYTICLYGDLESYLGEYLAQKGINKSEKEVFENDTEYIQFEG